MILTKDSLTLLLLCSHLAIGDETQKPYTLRDWNPLARRLQAASLHPADLLDAAAAEGAVQLTGEEVSRIAGLVSRIDDLQRELDRLEGLGVFALTRADEIYPQRYRQRLKDSAPPVLFYAGEKALLGQPGVAVVGSRHLDEAGQSCADLVGNACGISGLVLYSGGAKGVDTISMNAALAARGTAVGILAESLEKTIRDPDTRAALSRGDLCLATPYTPNAPFSVGAAMGRNKLIYALADYAVVVASDAEKGGTWAGATDALRAKWIPVFVLEHPAMPEGNKRLLQMGAVGFPHPFKEDRLRLGEWLEEHAGQKKSDLHQPSLF